MPKGKIHSSIYGALKRSAKNMSPLWGEKMLNAFALLGTPFKMMNFLSEGKLEFPHSLAPWLRTILHTP